MSAAEQLDIATENRTSYVVTFEADTRFTLARECVPSIISEDAFHLAVEWARRQKAFNRIPGQVIVQLRDAEGIWVKEATV